MLDAHGRRSPAILATLLAAAVALGTAGVVAAGRPGTYAGTLGGASYLIEVPAQWNRVLLLYSHGYVAPGHPDPAGDASDPRSRDWLLGHGYALAGSAYSQDGWAIQQAIPDQLALLRYFESRVGRPRRVIAWGESMGGLITASLLLSRPDLFSGGLPMCGVLSGTTGFWNHALDAAYVLKTLLAPGSSLELVRIRDPIANYRQARTIILSAQATASGRARLALVAALAGIPGWFEPASLEPPPADLAAREADQAQWEEHPYLYFAFGLRAEMETRAGGNPSGNLGVDYRRLLAGSPERDEVRALYSRAGLALGRDLAALAAGPRVAPDPAAARYAARYASLDGDLRVPVLTLHTIGDGLVQPGMEATFASRVRSRPGMLAQLYVGRAGHCEFTAAETVTALQALFRRIDTGSWGDLSPGGLDAAAFELGGALNRLWWPRVASAPAFAAYAPAPIRPG